MICSTHNMVTLTVLALGLLAAPATTQSSVPIHGTFATTFVQVPTSNPMVVTLLISCVGQAAHLGNSTASLVHTVDFSTAVQSGPSTYTAANGDQLFATYSGIAGAPGPNGVLQFAGVQTFTGGTGRFSGVTGTSLVQGTANVFTGVGQFTFSGIISK